MSKSFTSQTDSALRDVLLHHVDKTPEKLYLSSSLGDFTYFEIACIAAHLGKSLEPLSKKNVALNFKSQEQLFFFIWAAIIMQMDIVLLPTITDRDYLDLVMKESCADVLISDMPDVMPALYPVPPLQSFLAAKRGVDIAMPKWHDDKSPVIKFLTSGTSGRAKVITVLHSEFTTVLQSIFTNGFLPHAFDKTVFITPPLFHSYGLSTMLEYTFAGSTVVFPKDSLFTGPVRELVNPKISGSITAIEGAPYFYLQLCSILRKTELVRLKHIGFGGDAIDMNTIKQIDSYYPGLTYSIRYGLTETPSIVSGKTISFPFADAKSSGPILPLYDVHIIDEDGSTCPTGQHGEVVIASKSIFFGSGNSMIDQAAVFKTGDAGYMGPDNELYILGRKTGIIKHKGFRINVLSVEKLIKELNAVADCRVILQRNRLVAEVEIRDHAQLNSEDVIDFLKTSLPYYAIPDSIILVQEIPRTQTGKVKRNDF